MKNVVENLPKVQKESTQNVFQLKAASMTAAPAYKSKEKERKHKV